MRPWMAQVMWAYRGPGPQGPCHVDVDGFWPAREEGNTTWVRSLPRMARMGHDSERAAMIYQHVARGADQAITRAIDTHVEDEKPKDGTAGVAG